jgi:hypothetical protein
MFATLLNYEKSRSKAFGPTIHTNNDKEKRMLKNCMDAVLFSTVDYIHAHNFDNVLLYIGRMYAYATKIDINLMDIAFFELSANKYTDVKTCSLYKDIPRAFAKKYVTLISECFLCDSDMKNFVTAWFDDTRIQE